MLRQLVECGKLKAPNANPIREALESAQRKLDEGRKDRAIKHLETAMLHLTFAAVTGRITPVDARPLATEILRLVRSLVVGGWTLPRG